MSILSKYITRKEPSVERTNPNDWSSLDYRNIGRAIGEAMLNQQQYNDGIMGIQNQGTLDYPEVNWKMINEGPNMRGGLIPNPEYRDYTEGELYDINIEEDEENPWYANLMEYARNNLPNIVGRGALMQAGMGAGAMLGGLPGVLLGLFAGSKAPFRNTPSMQAWGQLNPTQRSYASDLYRPGGMLQGYNPVSAYGLGPIGTLQKRRENILRTINKPGYKGGLGKPGGRLEQIEKAITNTGGDLPGGSGDNRASWSPHADYSPSGLGTSTSLDYDGWED